MVFGLRAQVLSVMIGRKPGRGTQAGLNHELPTRAIIEQAERLIRLFQRYRIRQKIRARKGAAPRVDAHIQYIGHDAHESLAGDRCRNRRGARCIRQGACRHRAGDVRCGRGTTVHTHSHDRRWRQLGLILDPGLPHEQKHKRQGDEKQDALSIH
jgi:hypothetical protein